MKYQITNRSNSRHQVKTLDQGLVFLAPQQAIVARLEASYARLVSRSMSLAVERAPEGVAPGPTEQAEQPNPQEEAPDTTEQRQNGSSDAVEPTTRAEWAALAETQHIEIKKSWGINRIKAELERHK